LSQQEGGQASITCENSGTKIRKILRQSGAGRLLYFDKNQKQESDYQMGNGLRTIEVSMQKEAGYPASE
jgi:hypothetical protein